MRVAAVVEVIDGEGELREEEARVADLEDGLRLLLLEGLQRARSLVLHDKIQRQGVLEAAVVRDDEGVPRRLEDRLLRHGPPPQARRP